MDLPAKSGSLVPKELLVRPYKDDDYLQCREIFTEGMQQLVNPVMNVVYPRYFKMAGTIFLFFAAAAVSLSVWIAGLYLIVWVVLTALLYINIYIEVMKFVSACLNSDLLNISETYKDGSRIFVAELQGKVVGMVGLIKGGDRKDGVAELQRMSVSCSVRRRGIAKLLCEELITFAKEQDMNKIVLSTTGAQTAAIALYKKFGFRQTAKRAYPQKILEDLSYHFYELEI